jgi:hypothetical protein
MTPQLQAGPSESALRQGYNRLALASAGLALIATIFLLVYPYSTSSSSCSVGGCVDSHHSFLAAHGVRALLLFAIPLGVSIAAVLSSLERGTTGVFVLAVASVTMGAFVVVSLASLGLFYVPSLFCLALAFATRLRGEHS